MDFQLTPLEREALKLSLWVSAWAVVGSLPFGVFFAWLLSRKTFPGKTLLDGLLHLPLVLPPVVTGYLLLVTFGRRGVAGDWLYQKPWIQFCFQLEGRRPSLCSCGFSFNGSCDSLIYRCGGQADRMGRKNSRGKSDKGILHHHFAVGGARNINRDDSVVCQKLE